MPRQKLSITNSSTILNIYPITQNPISKLFSIKLSIKILFKSKIAANFLLSLS